MKFSALLPVVMAVFANQATAEPLRQPYKLNNARMSVRDIFGLQARQDGAYTPDQEFCGTGETCAEACGTGYKQACSPRPVPRDCSESCRKETNSRCCSVPRVTVIHIASMRQLSRHVALTKAEVSFIIHTTMCTLCANGHVLMSRYRGVR